MKLLGSISMDLDGLNCYYDSYSFGSLTSEDLIYTKAIPRYLEMFRELDLKITCFVIGRDLLNKKKHKIIEKIFESGHEIANHTMNHPFGFPQLSPVEKRQEILEADTLITKVTGEKPVGIRLPALGLDEECLNILEDLGYEYDSSILPVSILWLIKILYHLKNKGEKTTTGFGRFPFMFAPLKPYFPDRFRVWKKGDSRIMEIPITTNPFFRLPFWGTYHMATRFKTFPFDYWMLRRTKLPLNYQLHPIEMLDGEEPGLDAKARNILGMNFSYQDKRKNFQRVISRMKKEYNLVTLKKQTRVWKDRLLAANELKENEVAL